MRVAHVITRMMIGGAQENTLYNCQDLIRDFGDDVLLITGIETGPEGDLLSRPMSVDVPIRRMPVLQRAIHPLRDWQAYRQLRVALRDFKPDVVHTHSAKGGILGRMAAWAERVPAVVHTVHGAPFYPYQSAAARNFYRWAEHFAARRCHKLISVADAMTDLMVAGGVAPKEKFVTIYSGMEVDPFLNANEHRAATRAELGFTDSDVVIAKIARLFELKGHDDVIAAAGPLIAKCPSARFLLIGDGILRSKFEKQIADAGLTKHFVFTGLVDPIRIPSLLGAADLLVHASLREGLARALPQALIAGKPVVSYDIDGAREVCITNETGFLVPARDVAGLTQALDKLVSDEGLRNKLGQAGRQRFTNQFRHETMTKSIRAVYEGILAGGK
jgi:glycosyltransferase involved in cell wall biosynthesis